MKKRNISDQTSELATHAPTLQLAHRYRAVISHFCKNLRLRDFHFWT